MFKIEPATMYLYEIITVIERQTNLTYAVASAGPARHPHCSRSRDAFPGLFCAFVRYISFRLFRLRLTLALLKCLLCNQLIPVQKRTEIYRISLPHDFAM